MTRRDRYILIGLAVVGLLGALWFLAISPKRAELSGLNKKVDESEQTASQAQQEAHEFAQARLRFSRAYTNMARLGKAVPADPDVPSLVVQLEDAAKRASVDFRSVEIVAEEGEEGAGAKPQASAPPSGQSGGAQGSPGGQPAAPAPGGQGAPQGGGSAPAAPGATPGAAPVAADAMTTATEPLGTTVGPAGFPVMKIALKFQGSFFRMADFVHHVKTLVEQRNKRLLVSGRLVSIDGIAFGKGRGGFPRVKATIAATTYLIPSSQGLLAGATSTGPSAETPPAPAAGSAPPTAVVSGQ